MILWGIYALIGAYLIYRMFASNTKDSDYEIAYNEILTSDKYKVKGRND